MCLIAGIYNTHLIVSSQERRKKAIYSNACYDFSTQTLHHITKSSSHFCIEVQNMEIAVKEKENMCTAGRPLPETIRCNCALCRMHLKGK